MFDDGSSSVQDFYAAAVAKSRPMYLTPPTRYIYQSPKGVANALGLVGSLCVKYA